MVSQKKIDQIIKKYASVFRALEEFETTGRTIVKSRMNFTLDREIARKFRDHCKKHNWNMSAKIEAYMRDLLN
jgi:hypothetical protein